MFSPDEQTIVAQCTPRGIGAIALIRISGINAFHVAQNISKLPANKSLLKVASHTIHYGTLVDTQGNCIDKVLFFIMQAPATFTGQDTVEISCHNNQFIIETIIAQAINAGARLAQEGEFTKRAVLNGKIDLLQAEAINELIHAQTQLALKQSLEQLQGSFSYWLQTIEKELMKALALCQASFEFLDDEMEFSSKILEIITSLGHTVITLKKTFCQQQQIRQGIRIALIGSVNAGKSSLFNALLNNDRAIVNAQAGTTRDTIEAGLFVEGNYWTLIDTAGIRSTEDTIEQEGITRSFKEAHKADIILLIYDSTKELLPQEKAIYQQIKDQYSSKIICIYSKSDQTTLAKLPENIIAVSSTTRLHLPILEHSIKNKINELFARIESPFLLNQRHHQALLSLEINLKEMELLFKQENVPYELLCIHLNDAIAIIAQLTGKSITQASMDLIFKEFCIGK